MKENNPYNISPTFVVRTPLLSFNFIQNLLSDDSHLVENLKNAVRQPFINEAIFIAAPEFHEQLLKWLNHNDIGAKEEERILQTLYKYLSRMSSRCTPFGLFAGCAIGYQKDESKVEISRHIEHGRHTRLDMLYLCNLSYSLSKQNTIRNAILYYPNNSIYKSGDHLRYVEYRYKKDKRTHHLVQIKDSKYVSLVLQSANGKSIEELSQLLENEGIPIDQSKSFIEKLIENQILIGALDPTVTGDEFLNKILQTIAPIDCIDEIKSTLIRVNNKLNEIDKQIGNSPFQYIDIASDIKSLNVDFNIKNLFQTDLNINTKESSVSTGITESLAQGIIALNKLTDSRTTSNIHKFKEAFIRRYETRELELLKVLDTETGIGYLQGIGNDNASPLVDDIILPVKAKESTETSWTPTQKFLMNKLIDATSNNNYEIEITDKDLKQFQENWNDLPSTFSSLVKIIEAPSHDSPNGKILMEGVGGNSASTLLGRFCLNNDSIHQWVKEIINLEQMCYPDAILAEIVHLPESRVGNVILRPILRDYEIPFLTSPSVSREYVLDLDDLFISVKNNEIILRSKRLNKRIIPRLSNAHNYSANSVPIYQFLCDLQNQGLRTWIGFSWGRLTYDFPFKPRVTYKNLIFSPASWIIKKGEIDDIFSIKDDKKLLVAISQWREKRKIPKSVLFEVDDNMLYVDLENILSIKTLLSSVKKRDLFVLKEFLFNSNNAIVKCGEESFTNEFVFAFYKNTNYKI